MWQETTTTQCTTHPWSWTIMQENQCIVCEIAKLFQEFYSGHKTPFSPHKVANLAQRCSRKDAHFCKKESKMKWRWWQKTNFQLLYMIWTHAHHLAGYEQQVHQIILISLLFNFIPAISNCLFCEEHGVGWCVSRMLVSCSLRWSLIGGFHLTINNDF